MWYKFTLLLLFAAGNLAWGQLNMRLTSQVQYNSDLNDVWGYTAPDGTEYAIVGKVDGVSIVSLADPENAVEVASIPGQFSTWRDMKTFGEYCYVTTDQRGTNEGLTVIDMRNLPEDVSFTRWTEFSTGDDTFVLETCHNIYIDETGYGYLAGCNLNEGGMLYIDLFSTPGTPVFVDSGPPVYAHDVYVQDNLMYSSEIFEGQMAIYDVSDKNDTRLLGTINTPFNFTHNIWVNEDASVAFTTDERANAPVASYNVLDPEDIIELDQYRPAATLGEDVIPHNVHVWNNYLIISYYTDGGIVVDASRPDNLIEVGNFDTFFGVSGGFSGAWGAYPFFDSGLIIVTDINNGLFVLEPNYVRAAFLEGNVTNAATGQPLSGAEVVLNSDTEPNLNTSRIDGSYGTGLATAGTYTVSFSRLGYARLDTVVTITNGEVTLLDVALTPLPEYTITGQIQDEETGENIPGATIILRDDFVSFETQTNEEGRFELTEVFEGTYEIVAGAWGYKQTVFPDPFTVNEGQEVTFELARGYEDDFFFNLGWRSRSFFGATSGNWERGEPAGTSFQGAASNTNFDIPTDFGDQCYVTGNGGGGAGSADVDNGMVQLVSPPMELASRYQYPVVSYYSWFFNSGGDSAPNDSLAVRVSNGRDTITLEVVETSASEWRPLQSFRLDTIIELTDEMYIFFEASDFDPGHLVEAAVDVFRVEEGFTTNTNDLSMNDVSLVIAPNPFHDQLQLTYTFTDWQGSASIKLYDVLGQVVHEEVLDAPNGQVQLSPQLPNGVYWLSLQVGDRPVITQKVVRQ